MKLPHETYSHLAGVNVAVFGIAGYVLLLRAALWREEATTATRIVFLNRAT